MKNHTPVMEDEVCKYLKTDGYFLDLTIGTGGHTRKMLENYNCIAIGIDLDLEQLLIAKKNLSTYQGRFFLINSNYKDADNILKIKVESILLDAGISTFQLTSDRGFSFRKDSFLDMRFNKDIGKTAYDLISVTPHDKLAWILKEYGDVKNNHYIAKIIKEKIPKTTFELKNIILKSLKTKKIRKEIAKIFQSLRIYVNNELENFSKGIIAAYKLLKENGKFCVITYHSKEDRILIKTTKELGFKKIIKGMKPKRNEILTNKKSRSAKLRVFEK